MAIDLNTTRSPTSDECIHCVYTYSVFVFPIQIKQCFLFICLSFLHLFFVFSFVIVLFCRGISLFILREHSFMYVILCCALIILQPKSLEIFFFCLCLFEFLKVIQYEIYVYVFLFLAIVGVPSSYSFHHFVQFGPFSLQTCRSQSKKPIELNIECNWFCC